MMERNNDSDILMEELKQYKSELAAIKKAYSNLLDKLDELVRKNTESFKNENRNMNGTRQKHDAE